MGAGSGGGSATNSGIDFQQRIAALVFSHMLAEMESFDILRLGENVIVTEIGCETADEIDDIVLATTRGRVFIQAKRALSLSDKPNSEFSKVIKQFVSQFIKSDIETDTYLLATSSCASQRITRELRKLSEAARLNELGNTKNPLTKAELDVFGRTRRMAEATYRTITGNCLSDRDWQKIFKRIRVAIVDIDEGSPHESAVMLLLASKSRIAPSLLWGSLVAFGLALAKGRLSVDLQGLRERYGKYFIGPHEEAKNCEVDELIKPILMDGFPARCEVLLVKNYPVFDTDYCIFELHRFEDDGTKRLKFRDNIVVLKSGNEMELVYRSASIPGMQRYIDSRPELCSAGASIAMVPAEGVVGMHYAKLHSEYCAKLLETSKSLLMCVHCGDPISEDESSLVEIDVEGQEHRVGLSHASCLMISDRVSGLVKAELFQENKQLRRFDYRKWFEKIVRGQGLFRSMQSLSNSFNPIAWNPSYSYVGRGDWCVRINLDDGSACYACERGKVGRSSMQEAEKIARDLNSSYEKGREANNRWGYSSELGMYSTYSGLLKAMRPSEKVIFCLNAEVVRYSQSIGEAYSAVENFYAPLLVLLEADSGLPFVIENAAIILTDPMAIDRFLQNWKMAGFALPEFTVSIIESDAAFDAFVHGFKNVGKRVVINPMFSPDSTVTSGFIVENLNDMLSE